MIKKLFLFFVFLVLLGCQELHTGMTEEEVKKVANWGEPEAKVKIPLPARRWKETNSIEVWHYIIYGIDTIVFFKEGAVLGQLKFGPQDKIWEVVTDWVNYVKSHPAHLENIEKHLKNILNHHLWTGMTREETCLSWGSPVRINKSHLRYGLCEEWFYNRPAYRQTRLEFINGILMDWKEMK